MNKTLQDGIELAKVIDAGVKAGVKADVVVLGVPFIHLSEVCKIASCVNVAAQNCSDKYSGAYTGEVSAEMVKSTGASYVILGHSERREYFQETSEMLNDKIARALEQNLNIIFCCGESLDIRENGTQNVCVRFQLEQTVFKLSCEQFKKISIAYEPIWAIGTGKTATKNQAQDIHAFIRWLIAKKYGKKVSKETSILYGGSCNAANAQELFEQADIDGGLIGGASLKAADFLTIANSY